MNVINACDTFLLFKPSIKDMLLTGPGPCWLCGPRDTHVQLQSSCNSESGPQ